MAIKSKAGKAKASKGSKAKAKAPKVDASHAPKGYNSDKAKATLAEAIAILKRDAPGCNPMTYLAEVGANRYMALYRYANS